MVYTALIFAVQSEIWHHQLEVWPHRLGVRVGVILIEMDAPKVEERVMPPHILVVK